MTIGKVLPMDLELWPKLMGKSESLSVLVMTCIKRWSALCSLTCFWSDSGCRQVDGCSIIHASDGSGWIQGGPNWVNVSGVLVIVLTNIVTWVRFALDQHCPFLFFGGGLLLMWDEWGSSTSLVLILYLFIQATTARWIICVCKGWERWLDVWPQFPLPLSETGWLWYFDQGAVLRGCG